MIYWIFSSVVFSSKCNHHGPIITTTLVIYYVVYFPSQQNNVIWKDRPNKSQIKEWFHAKLLKLEIYLKTCQTSKMKFFAKIVHCWKLHLRCLTGFWIRVWVIHISYISISPHLNFIACTVNLKMKEFLSGCDNRRNELFFERWRTALFNSQSKRILSETKSWEYGFQQFCALNNFLILY